MPLALGDGLFLHLISNRIAEFKAMGGWVSEPSSSPLAHASSISPYIPSECPELQRENQGPGPFSTCYADIRYGLLKP